MLVEVVGGTRHPSGDHIPRHSSSSMLRSRSSQSLRPSHDVSGPAADDRLTVLVQMFWISVSLLESDFEYEFLLAVRLLDKVYQTLGSYCQNVFLKFQQAYPDIIS